MNRGGKEFGAYLVHTCSDTGVTLDVRKWGFDWTFSSDTIWEKGLEDSDRFTLRNGYLWNEFIWNWEIVKLRRGRVGLDLDVAIMKLVIDLSSVPSSELIS